VTVIRKHARSRRLADTDRGAACRHEIEMLERLVELYRTNDLAQTDASQPRRD
jgi:hypothetical protein